MHAPPATTTDIRKHVRLHTLRPFQTAGELIYTCKVKKSKLTEPGENIRFDPNLDFNLIFFRHRLIPKASTAQEIKVLSFYWMDSSSKNKWQS